MACLTFTALIKDIFLFYNLNLRYNHGDFRTEDPEADDKRVRSQISIEERDLRIHDCRRWRIPATKRHYDYLLFEGFGHIEKKM